MNNVYEKLIKDPFFQPNLNAWSLWRLTSKGTGWNDWQKKEKREGRWSSQPQGTAAGSRPPLLPGSHRCCNLSAEEEAAHRDQHDCEMMRMAAAPLLLAFMRFHPWRTQLFVCALLLPFFLCWGFPSGSLRLMLMVDFPIRCNRSRAYGRDSCCCVIAAPEKHTPRSDISPQGPIFCHSCGLFSIMMEMGESCFELNLYYSAIHFRNITKPDTEQGIHHRLPAAKVLCLTALKRRPRPPSLARFG